MSTTKPIVCTPDVCGGSPRLEGTRLTVECITGRFAAGESVADLAADYEVDPREIEAMIRALCEATFGRHGMLAPVYRRLVANARTT